MVTYILDRCKQALLNNQNSTHTAARLHYCPSIQATLQVMALDRAINAANVIHSRANLASLRLSFQTRANRGIGRLALSSRRRETNFTVLLHT